MKPSMTAISIGLLACCSLSHAQQDLGMRITGDSDSNFGLTISNWVNGNQTGTLAPGLLKEQILPLDAAELERQIELERAASAPGAAINRGP